MSTTSERTKQIIALSSELEAVKSERDHLRAQLIWLQGYLQQTTERADRAEIRLHQVTMTMADLGRQAIAAPMRSAATEVLMDGKSILRLSNPVHVANRSAAGARM
jgi:chromosome segregation ATPase